MVPATNGCVSSTYGLPSRLVVMPAPSASATAITSSRACRAPWPTNIATREPASSTAAADANSVSAGRTREADQAGAVTTMPCCCGRSATAFFRTSCGTITTAGARPVRAARNARSSTIGSCSAELTNCENPAATSLTSAARSISCM